MISQKTKMKTVVACALEVGEFAEVADDFHSNGVQFAFGGTPPVVERACAFGFLEVCFDGIATSDSVWAYLKGAEHQELTKIDYPQTTLKRNE